MAELMKGKTWQDRKHLVKYPVIAEVKYDEIRVHVKLDGLGVQFLSYAGKPLLNLGPWEARFYQFMRISKLTELDMGVEVNGNFNDSYRWVRSKKVPEGLDAGMVKFLLFDLPDLTTNYIDRRHARYNVCLTMNRFGISVSAPESVVCDTEDEVHQFFSAKRAEGREGLMIKDPHHLYQKGKRIDGWLKMKPEETFDGYITKINRAVSIEGVPLDRAGSIDVRLEDDSTASPAGIPHELGRDMWLHPEKYLGQWVEFKAMERDRQGGYRHPSLVRLREAK